MPGEHAVVITYLVIVFTRIRKVLFGDFVLIRCTRTERTELFVVVLRRRKYIGVFQSRLILPVVVHNDFERALFRHGTGTAAYTVAVRDNGIVQCLGALVGRHFEANFLEVRSLSRSRISISSRRVGLISKHSAGEFTAAAAMNTAKPATGLSIRIKCRRVNKAAMVPNAQTVEGTNALMNSPNVTGRNRLT